MCTSTLLLHFHHSYILVGRCFSVGCTTAFGIVMRLDRLMVATKELVGEQYHIHGVGVSLRREFTNNTTNTRPAKDA